LSRWRRSRDAWQSGAIRNSRGDAGFVEPLFGGVKHSGFCGAIDAGRLIKAESDFGDASNEEAKKGRKSANSMAATTLRSVTFLRGEEGERACAFACVGSTPERNGNPEPLKKSYIPPPRWRRYVDTST
jgi:hypothetical protein